MHRISDCRTSAAQPIFSEFLVSNPKIGTQYRVAIRGSQPGENYCSCPDFAVNTLGICKHIEYTLLRLRRTPKGEKALAAGFNQPYSEVFLCYGVKREVMFKAGSECPQHAEELAKQYFDSRGFLREDAYARFHTFIRSGRWSSRMTCAVTMMPWSLLPKSETKTICRRVVRKAFPQGIDSAALQRPFAGLSLPLSEKRSVVCRTGRQVPNRRRYGPWQNRLRLLPPRRFCPKLWAWSGC